MKEGEEERERKREREKGRKEERKRGRERLLWKLSYPGIQSTLLLLTCFICFIAMCSSAQQMDVFMQKSYRSASVAYKWYPGTETASFPRSDEVFG